MADSKISDLTENTTIAGSEELHLADSGTSKKIGLDTFNRLAPKDNFFTLHNSRYFGTKGTDALTTSTYSLDRMYVMPFTSYVSQTVTRIGTEVTTAQSGATIRLGIYEAGTDGLPGALVLDAGTVDASSTGAKEITISQTLYGNYFLAWCQQEGTAVTVRAALVDEHERDYAGADSSSSDNSTQIYQNSVTGALPDPAVIAGFNSLINNPHVWLRIV